MKTVIIGGVAAGMSAATKIKRNNPSSHVVVIEQTSEVSYGACGLPYYVSGVNENQDLLRIRTVEQFISAKIDLRIRHKAVRVDAEQQIIEVLNTDKEELYCESYDTLVIATGASPIVPQIPGIDLDNIHTLKSIADAERIKTILASEDIEKVAIVGAGLIGMELVESMVLQGKEVRLIELAKRVLTVFDEEITEAAEQEVKSQGVELHLNEQVIEVIGKSKVEAVRTNLDTYSADVVIFAIGVKPNTDFLKGSAIELNQQGAVIVSPTMQTNYTNVYSGGDCATVYHKILHKNVYLPLGTNANKQGKIIGENVGSSTPISYRGSLGSVAVKILDIEMGKTGITEQEAIANNTNYGTIVMTAPDRAPYYPNPTEIKIKLVYDKKFKTLLGAQLVGKKGAVLRTDVFAACIDQQMTADEVAYLDLVYAPPFSTVWDSVNIAAGLIK